MRFHVVSLPHTQTTAEFSACAFTTKVRLFCQMMMSLGHEVFLYAGERNTAPCTEHIPCVDEASSKKFIGDEHYSSASFNFNLPFWRQFNTKAANAIKTRAKAKDLLCVIGGLAHKQIADMLPGMLCIEFGVGYGGTFTKMRVFESYAWMHTIYGAQTGGNANAADGVWYDEVIPCYIDMEQFPYIDNAPSWKEYYLYIGRLIDRKGFGIAIDACKAKGARLIIAGPGEKPAGAYGEFIGVVGPEKRAELMSGAIATFVPTKYIEPGGNVVVESLACGTPVISTDWGVMTETVIQGVTGYRCRMLSEFIDAMEKVKSLDRKIIRRHAKDNYSLPVIAKRYEDYFLRASTLFGKGWYAT